MGSNKCTLRKEIKNEIAKYIDNEFMNETMKEIVNYIKTTSKVVIDDSNYDESDIDSRVELKDNGAFNIHDYMYVKDFLYELSWEGSYVEVLEEDEDTIDGKKVFKYEGKDIATVIYEKVDAIMETKKGKLYKEFKKKFPGAVNFSFHREVYDHGPVMYIVICLLAFGLVNPGYMFLMQLIDCFIALIWTIFTTLVYNRIFQPWKILLIYGDRPASELVDKTLPERLLAAEPFDGIEVWHPSADARAQAHWLALAKEHGLLVSGGSDFHGIPDRFPTKLGIWQVQYDDVKGVIEWK